MNGKKIWAIVILLVAVAISARLIVGNKTVSPLPTMVTATTTEMVAEADSYGLHLPPPGKEVVAPAGRQVYEISQGGNPLPMIAETVIDPPAVHVGDMQHLEVLVSSPSPITKVYAVSRLDSKDVKVPLLFVKNETRNGQTYERYEGDWKVVDTHNTLYMTAFFAEDSAGNVNHVEHAWSDACGIPVSGAYTLPYSCSISSADGVENGNFALGSGVTLTLTSKLMFDPGYSIVLNGATLALGAGGSLQRTTGGIYMGDNDRDGWPRDANQYPSLAACQAAEGVACVPRNQASTYGTPISSFTTDCNDNAASLSNNCGGGGGTPSGCCWYVPVNGSDACGCSDSDRNADGVCVNGEGGTCAYICNDNGCGVQCC